MQPVVLFVALTLLAGAPLAQSADPITADIQSVYDTVKRNITRAAEKMPEENYSFKPSDDVRTFAQLIGHIADANYSFCSAARGDARPQVQVEKTKTAKADLVGALNESFAFCDAAFAGMTDAKGAELVKFFGRERPRLGVLAFNNTHDYEHYGNLVTYMRIKGIVPPSSEPRR